MDKYGSLWSRDELTLALYLYCQIPFSKTKANNPEVIKLAKLIGRTPASVARKLGNFGAFDPLLARQGISGLMHVGSGDRLVWNEYYDKWEELVEASNRLLSELPTPVPTTKNQRAAIVSEDEEIITRPTGPSERKANISVRLFQSFFRRTVLASYDSSCCICGLNIRSLLIASHIKPWSVDESARSEPENGLCLCSIHDRAFDRGLIAVSEGFQLIVASEIIPSKQRFVQTALVEFHGQPLQMPRRFLPRREYLAWHRKNIFGSVEAAVNE